MYILTAAEHDAIVRRADAVIQAARAPKPIVLPTWLSYESSHTRVRRLWGQARNHPCIDCGKPAQHWAYDGSDPSELIDAKRGWLYSMWPEYYAPMCISCHKQLDLRRLAVHRGSKPLQRNKIHAIQ